MIVYTIDPLNDPRWAELVSQHDSASVFHSNAWLEALWRTYRYKPVVYTTSPPSSPLSNGLVVCHIKSWLTGRRIVSLPFSDHCDPLLDDTNAGHAIITEVRNSAVADKYKYLELRPRSDMRVFEGAVREPRYYLHALDLRPTETTLLSQAHKTGVQQPIRRAEREGVVYQRGNSEQLLKAFYRLMLQTRRRHQLPPQPIQWFKNIVACMGDKAQIRVAFKSGREIAGILTLQYRDAIVYKYGCSASAFQNLGGTAFLLWKAIVEAKAAGLTWMDFGRSDSDNKGLIKFKERWGAKSSELAYVRWTLKASPSLITRPSRTLAKKLLPMMPEAVIQATGRVLYRHAG